MDISGNKYDELNFSRVPTVRMTPGAAARRSRLPHAAKRCRMEIRDLSPGFVHHLALPETTFAERQPSKSE